MLAILAAALGTAAADAPPVHLAVCDQQTAIYLGALRGGDTPSSPPGPFAPAIPPSPDALEKVKGTSWRLIQTKPDGASRAWASPTWAPVNHHEQDLELGPCTDEVCADRRVDLGSCADPHGTLYTTGSWPRLYDQPLPEGAADHAALQAEATRLGMTVAHTQQIQSAKAALAVTAEPIGAAQLRATLLLHHGDWRTQVPVSRWMGPATYAAPVNISHRLLVVEIFGGERTGWMVVIPAEDGFTSASMWSRISHD